MIQDPTTYDGQFVFQRMHATGAVLNVGSNTDGAHFGLMGGVNVDLYRHDPVTNLENPVHVLADGRSLPFRSASFDTVVLGELLEHMERDTAVVTLKEARRAARHRVVITMPHDDRREHGTEPAIEAGKEFYAPGVYAYHHRCISRAELLEWVRAAGLKPLLAARIEYVWGPAGTGLVAQC